MLRPPHWSDLKLVAMRHSGRGLLGLFRDHRLRSDEQARAPELLSWMRLARVTAGGFIFT